MEEILEKARDQVDAELRVSERRGNHYEVEVKDEWGNWQPTQIFMVDNISESDIDKEEVVEAIITQVKYLTTHDAKN